MTTYISMLRGINVSGHKKVNMQELKQLYKELNLENVRTYIQSGNVVFESSQTDPVYLAGLISKALYEKYSFEVPVLITTTAELEATVSGNLFLQRENIETDKLYVIFLWQTPSAHNLEKIKVIHFEPDEFIIVGKTIYLYCPGGYGRTKLTNTFFETKLQVMATTRNWRTINELIKIAHQE